MAIRYLCLCVLYAACALAAEPSATVVSSFHPEVTLSRDVLTNEGVVALADAGYSPAFIMEKIRMTSRTHFDTTVEGLTYLRRNAIPEDLVECMIDPVEQGSASGPKAVSAPVPLVLAGKRKSKKLVVRIPRMVEPAPIVYVYYGGNPNSFVEPNATAPVPALLTRKRFWWR